MEGFLESHRIPKLRRQKILQTRQSQASSSIIGIGPIFIELFTNYVMPEDLTI
jgi:hypothetical protein